jgi:dihydrodipicolinate synthase/N-acetylneuraminate lyase
MSCVPRHETVSSTVTPFDIQGNPDIAGFAELLEFQINAGIRAFFLLGTMGEGLSCQPHERMAIVDEMLPVIDGRAVVLVNCTAADSRTAQDIARHAQQAGAHGVAATAPLFLPFSQNALYRHFASVVDAAPAIEHYVYENPARVGLEVGPAVVNRLVREVGPVVGVKDTGDTLTRITQYCLEAPETRVFTGGNSIILAALEMGAWGTVSALSSAVPELLVRLHTAFRDGDLISCRELQLDIARFTRCLHGLPYMAAVKELARMRGLRAGRVRAPLDELSADEAGLLHHRLDAAGVSRWLEPVA